MKKAAKKSPKNSVAAEARAFHYDVIVSPVVTEKSTAASEHNKVVFNVSLNADKASIKSAVEALFNVKVKKVNTLVRMGKTRRFRNTLGKLSDTKKAVITLAEGQAINLEGGLK